MVPFPDEEPEKRVAVIEHNPTWAAEFDRLAAVLVDALGRTAMAIDHIGSTAVPGLPTKDCIDIQVRVASIEDSAVPDAFAGLGFRLRPEPWNRVETSGGREWPKLVFAPPAGARSCNVHVRAAAAATARRNLLFRDYLRADHDARKAWGEFKRRLAGLGVDLVGYGTVKQPATEILMIAAESWVIETNWRL